MSRSRRRFVVLVFVIGLAFFPPALPADSVGDFFQRLGRSIAKLTHPSPTPKPAHKSNHSHEKDHEAKSTESPAPSPIPTATVIPTPTPLEIRPATSAPPDRKRPRDLPYGIAVPSRPGLVTSPYAPNQGYVDVRGFPSSTEVMDPFTGKVFLTP